MAWRMMAAAAAGVRQAVKVQVQVPGDRAMRRPRRQRRQRVGRLPRCAASSRPTLASRFWVALISKLTVARASTKLTATTTTTATRSWKAHQAASAAIPVRLRVAAVPPRPQPAQ